MTRSLIFFFNFYAYLFKEISFKIYESNEHRRLSITSKSLLANIDRRAFVSHMYRPIPTDVIPIIAYKFARLHFKTECRRLGLKSDFLWRAV